MCRPRYYVKSLTVQDTFRPHQLCWGDREMGTAISCIKYSQVACLAYVKVSRSSSAASSLHAVVLRAGVFRAKIVAVITVTCYRWTRKRKRKCVCMYAYTEALDVHHFLS